MKEGQNDIPYITDEIIAVASSLRVIKKNLIELVWRRDLADKQAPDSTFHELLVKFICGHNDDIWIGTYGSRRN